MDMELIDAVQEHVDAAYDPDADIHDDPIDWTHAEKTAHEHLDKFVGYDAVQKAIKGFQMKKPVKKYREGSRTGSRGQMV